LAAARNRWMPASQALSIASRWGTAPAESSQRTRDMTARTMCLASAGRRLAISSISESGRAGLDLVATGGILATLRPPPCFRHQVLLLPAHGPPHGRPLPDEVQDLPPGVLARLPVPGERAVEE